MSQPRYLADEDLRGSIVKAVRRAEPAIKITTIVEQGMAGASDEEALQYAWQQQWIMVSHDINTMKAVAEAIAAAIVGESEALQRLKTASMQRASAFSGNRGV